MLFALYCKDKAESSDVRARHRSDHVSFLKHWGDAVSLAGPLLSDDGETMIGSLILLEVPDRATAERFISEDPYGHAQLFESVTLHPFKQVLRQPQ